MKTKYNVIRTSDGLLVITFTEKRLAERYAHNFNKKYEESGLDIKLKIVIGDLHLEESDGKIVVKKRNGSKFNGDKK
jgi:hypothetical protein